MMKYAFDGSEPQVDPSVYVAPTAVIIGNVKIGKDSSVWFHCVLRGDDNAINIGSETNIQDITMLHSDPRQILSIGNRITVGHRCILHGCTIDDDCLVGMGAIILTGARVGRGSIIAAGAVVKEDTIVPPFSLVAGVPGRVIRTYQEDVLDRIREPAHNYLERSRAYKNINRFKAIE